jgi:hypothetical protein
MLFNNFSELVEWSKSYAREIETMVENHFYNEYNWGTVIFETDKFGGSYIQLKFFPNENNKLILDFGSTERESDNLNEIKVFILNEKIKMEKSRDLNHIYEMINSEY